MSALRLRARSGAAPLGLVFGAVGLASAVAVRFLHLDHLPVVVCYFKAFSGLPCPTCGSTRMLGRLAAGDLRGAFEMNPLASVVAAILAAWAIADLVLLLRRRALAVEVSPGLARLLRVLAVFVLLLNWGYLLAAGR